jgi:hypothetical protein
MININLIIFLILILAIFKYSNYKNEKFSPISASANNAVQDSMSRYILPMRGIKESVDKIAQQASNTAVTSDWGPPNPNLIFNTTSAINIQNDAMRNAMRRTIDLLKNPAIPVEPIEDMIMKSTKDIRTYLDPPPIHKK